MRKLYFLLMLLLPALVSQAQSAEEIHQNGVRFLQQGDYGNAIILLKKAVELDQQNVEYVNNLGIAYYMAGQYKTGYELLVPIAESKLGNDQTFVIAAMNLRGGKNKEEAAAVYQMGLAKFPKSGALYADYGDYLQNAPPDKNGNVPSIQLWEKGIQAEPGYPLNYYHAAKYYNKFNNSFWAAIYGEIFVNLETYSNRTVEIKNLIFDAYKRMYAYELKPGQIATNFETGVKQTLANQNALIFNGITPEILTAIRTRFILDWYVNGGSQRFPFALFDYQQRLLQQGIFDAYNQWLFGSVANISVFQTWTKLNSEQYVAFNQDRRNYYFHVGLNEYYR